MQQADVIIIGSGQGGVPLARANAREGKEVVLFERGQFGGTCVNYGCLPSKAFLASAHAAARARNAGPLGVHAQVTVDYPAVMARARETIRNSQKGVEDGLIDAGVRLIKATASFQDEQTVQGGDIEVQAPLIVINTGKSPALPPIPGLETVDCLTYETFWQLDCLPQRTLVLGGGYVGVELGQGLARLGSEVTMVEHADRIIAHEEAKVGEVLTQALEADGVKILLETEVSEVWRQNDAIIARLDDDRTLTVDALLIATGRKPNTHALNTDRAGVQLDDTGHVQVNEHFTTSNPAVYAIGDVIGQAAFTHVSWEDHRRVRAILAGEERCRGDRVLAYVFFTEPQVGRVGMTLAEARKRGFDANAASIPLTQVARARLTGNELGFYRMVVDRNSNKILGATLVGPQAGEVVQIFLAHMEAGTPWQALERSMHVHPTYAEALPVLARQFCG